MTDDRRLRVTARHDLRHPVPVAERRDQGRRIGRRGDEIEVAHGLAAAPDAACLRHGHRRRMRGELFDHAAHCRERLGREADASSALSPTPASSALRIFSSLRAPIPERSRSRPSSAALLRPSSDVMPSCVQMRAAVFGPTPGSRRKSTTPAGTRPRRLVSACISPSSTTSTTLFSIVLPIPGQLLGLPVERELGDRQRGLADPPRRTAVRDDLERLLLEDLRDVREQVELVRELVVAGQRLRHPAMIRRCLARSCASRRTTSARTSRP